MIFTQTEKQSCKFTSLEALKNELALGLLRKKHEIQRREAFSINICSYIFIVHEMTNPQIFHCLHLEMPKNLENKILLVFITSHAVCRYALSGPLKTFKRNKTNYRSHPKSPFSKKKKKKKNQKVLDSVATTATR